MRYALIGDSHTQVLWPLVSATLKKAGHEVVLTRAQPGWSAASYQKEGKLPAQLAAARPDVVVFNVANNNQDRDASRYGARVAWAVDAARAAGARSIFWQGPTHATRADVAAYHDATAAMEPELVARTGASWVDSRPFTQTGHRDGVHFDNATYRAWAAAIAEGLLAQAPSAAPSVTGVAVAAGAAIQRTRTSTRNTALALLALLGLVGVGIVITRR